VFNFSVTVELVNMPDIGKDACLQCP
jgi:hypothetical protein